MNPEALQRVRALAVQFADALIAAVTGASAPGEYRARGPLPRGVSRRLFCKVCRSGRVEKALKLGREWSCTRAAWDAARATKAAPSLDDEEIAMRALRGDADNVVPFRATRRVR